MRSVHLHPVDRTQSPRRAHESPEAHTGTDPRTHRRNPRRDITGHDGVREVKSRTVVAHTGKPVLNVSVKLTRKSNPAARFSAKEQAYFNINARPDRGAQQPVETATAQATLVFAGHPTRAHAAAKSTHEAIDLLKERLEQRLTRLERHWGGGRRSATGREPQGWRHSAAVGRHWEEHRSGRPVKESNTWQHGSEPAHRPDYYPRPPEQRSLVRHKSFSLSQETVDEAVFEMEAMDYDFHLFTEIESGEDTVVYRTNPENYRIAQVHPNPDRDTQRTAVSVTASSTPAQVMSVAEAEQRLDLTGSLFVFFADKESGRGNVLYHRYDGHIGLITPAE